MATMSVRPNVNAFGESVGPSPTSSSQIRHTSGADEYRERFGDKDIGTVLNEIVDPNWIDPSRRMRTTGSSEMDKDTFFKLMLTQMKHQDPMNPLQSHEMAAQLAQFTSLEQLQNINSTLEEMRQGQKPGENFQVLSMIGRTVGGDSSRIFHDADADVHDFMFNLPADASQVAIRVRDSNGIVVREYDLRDLKKGENMITWNGQDSRGLPVRPGNYQFHIEAMNENGQGLAVNTSFEGRVTGVNYTPEGPVLLIGNQSVRLSDVRRINDESIKQNDQKVQNVTDQDLNKDREVSENESKALMAEEALRAMDSQVGMASGLRDQIARGLKE